MKFRITNEKKGGFAKVSDYTQQVCRKSFVNTFRQTIYKLSLPEDYLKTYIFLSIETIAYNLPINNLPKSLQIIRTTVAIIDVISMFPYIAC